MIKVSSGRESVEGLFGENISVVSILRRNNNIVFLSSNSKLGGQGSFSYVFITEQDSLFYPINVRIVFC